MPNKIFPYNRNLKALARKLRNNPTKAEAILWNSIRKKSLGVEFHRQVPVHSYILDFYCHEIGLAIEVDGNIHDTQFLEDAQRQGELESLGIRFLRFKNEEVFEKLDWVLKEIGREISELK